MLPLHLFTLYIYISYNEMKLISCNWWAICWSPAICRATLEWRKATDEWTDEVHLSYTKVQMSVGGVDGQTKQVNVFFVDS